MNGVELKLAIAACRAAYQGSSALHLGDLTGIDWSRFFDLAVRHRVEALCWQGLTQVGDQIPSSVAEQFLKRSTSIVESNLRAAAECARLRAAFDKAGLPVLFLKGLTLGSLAYPQPFLKMSSDIDLLVDSSQLEQAFHLLRGAGFHPTVPHDRTNNALKQWHLVSKESVWITDAGNFTLDLHSRVADNPGMVPGLGVKSPSQRVSVAPGVELATFAKDELFAYLCVHGASSAWFRLKWLTDISALLHREAPEEIARLYYRSQHIGAGRAADQALLLAEEYFGIILPADLSSRLHSSRAARWLARVATKQLTSSIEPTMRFLGTASIHYSQPFLQPSLRFKFSEIAGQLKLMVGSA